MNMNVGPNEQQPRGKINGGWLSYTGSAKMPKPSTKAQSQAAASSAPRTTEFILDLSLPLEKSLLTMESAVR